MACCSEVVNLLADYLDERLPNSTQRDLEQHLSGCPSCVAYLNTYRSTVSLLRSLAEDDPPPELRARLAAFLDHRNTS